MDDKLLSEALDDYLERRVRIPIRAATASANREVTKQNQLLLNQALMIFVKEASTMIQAVMNAQAPGFYKKWLIAVIKSRVRFMQQVIREFQISDQPEEYVPNIEFPEEEGEAAGGERGKTQGTGGGIVEMANRLRQRRGNAGPGQPSGLEAFDRGPTGPPSGAVL